MTEYGPEVRLMDAMAEDLRTNANLPTKLLVVKYRAPRIIEPQDCPLLVIRVDDSGKIAAPDGTVRTRSFVPIALEYHEEVVQEVKTLVDDEAKSLSLWLNAKKIEQRVWKWTIEDPTIGGVDLGVDEAFEIDAVGLIPFTMEDGFIEGISVLVSIRITEDGSLTIG